MTFENFYFSKIFQKTIKLAFENFYFSKIFQKTIKLTSKFLLKVKNLKFQK